MNCSKISKEKTDSEIYSILLILTDGEIHGNYNDKKNIFYKKQKKF